MNHTSPKIIFNINLPSELLKIVTVSNSRFLMTYLHKERLSEIKNMLLKENNLLSMIFLKVVKTAILF